MLRLERRYIEEIIAHARLDAPNECCGIIAGKGGRATNLYRAPNGAANQSHYKIPEEDLEAIFREILKAGWDVLAIYHSHTHTEAYPSPTDVKLAAWPDARYLIVSLEDDANPVLRAFRIQDGQVTEEELEVG